MLPRAGGRGSHSPSTGNTGPSHEGSPPLLLTATSHLLSLNSKPDNKGVLFV